MIALLAAVRAIHFASLMTIFGGSAYAALLARARLWRSPANAVRLLFATAAALAIVSGIVWFAVIAGQMSGSWEGSLDPATLQLAGTGTRFGHIFLVRFIGLAALCFMCVRASKTHSLSIAILAGLLLASLGPISHAAATGGDIALAGAANDAAHVLTAGFWVGGLVVLAMFLPAHRTDPDSFVAALRMFSSWGTAVVALLVVTGLINAISIVPLSAMTLRNSYFDLFVVKVGMAAVMIALAALNRWRFAPSLRTGGDKATRGLACSIGIEMVLGFIVIAVAACLGSTSPH